MPLITLILVSSMLLYLSAGAKNVYFNLHLRDEIETVPKIQILTFEQGN